MLKRTAVELIDGTEGMISMENLFKKWVLKFNESYDKYVKFINEVIDGAADQMTISLAHDTIHQKEKDMEFKMDQDSMVYDVPGIAHYANFYTWMEKLGEDIDFSEVLNYIDEDDVCDRAVASIMKKRHGRVSNERLAQLTRANIEDYFNRVMRVVNTVEAEHSSKSCYNENGCLLHEDGTLWEVDYIAQYKEFPEELIKAFYEVVDEKTGKLKIK